MTFDPKLLKRDFEMKSEEIFFSIDTDAKSGRSYLGSSDFGVYEFEEQAGERKKLRFDGGHQSYVTGISVVEHQLASVSYDRKLIFWDRESRQIIRTIPAHDRWIRRVVRFPDGRRIATIADDMLCKVWDVETGELVAAFTDHRPETPHGYPSMLYALAVSSDGNLIATGDKVGHVAIWDAAKYVKIGEVATPVMYTWDSVQRHHSIGGIRSLAFSPDGKNLAVGGIGTIGNIDHLGGPARLEVFDWRAGKQVVFKEDNERKGLIEQIAWAPDGSWLLTAGGDHKGFVTFWGLDQEESLHHEVAAGHIHGFVLDCEAGIVTVAGHEHLTRWKVIAEVTEAKDS